MIIRGQVFNEKAEIQRLLAICLYAKFLLQHCQVVLLTTHIYTHTHTLGSAGVVPPFILRLVYRQHIARAGETTTWQLQQMGASQDVQKRTALQVLPRSIPAKRQRERGGRVRARESKRDRLSVRIVFFSGNTGRAA